MQIRSVVAVAFAGLASSVAPAQEAVQWRVEDGGNGHWYQATVMPATVSWETAYASAQSQGGYLATLVTEAEGAFIASRLSARVGYPTCQTFIGGYRTNGSWHWMTGEAGAFWPWNCGHCHVTCQPDWSCENFATIMCTSGGNVRLNNAGGCIGNGESGFLIEWSADCDGNGIVDYGEILDGTREDSNADGVPDCCDAGISCDPCPADLDDSNAVDAEDLASILFAWGTDGGKASQADITRDGTVDASDLSIVLGSWGSCPD